MFLEFFAAVTTLLGFGLISIGDASLGFGISIVANLAWVRWGYPRRAYSLVALQVGFVIFSILGILKLGQ